MPPEYRGRRSRDRSCSLTMRLTGEPAESPHQFVADRVQRRGRRPCRRVQHRRPRRIEAERRVHCVARERAIDQTIDFRHADQPDRGAVRVDGARVDEVVQPPSIDEEQPVPDAHRFGWRVEAVLAADAVKHLDAARPAQLPGPHEVRGEVRVERQQRCSHRADDRASRPAAAKIVAHAPGLFAGDEREAHAGIVAHRRVHRREHRVVHRRAAVDEDSRTWPLLMRALGRTAATARDWPPPPGRRRDAGAPLPRPATASAST